MTENQIIDLAIASCIQANGGVMEWGVCYTGHKLAEINSYLSGYYAALGTPLDFEVSCEGFYNTTDIRLVVLESI